MCYCDCWPGLLETCVLRGFGAGQDCAAIPIRHFAVLQPPTKTAGRTSLLAAWRLASVPGGSSSAGLTGILSPTRRSSQLRVTGGQMVTADAQGEVAIHSTGFERSAATRWAGPPMSMLAAHPDGRVFAVQKGGSAVQVRPNCASKQRREWRSRPLPARPNQAPKSL